MTVSSQAGKNPLGFVFLMRCAAPNIGLLDLSGLRNTAGELSCMRRVAFIDFVVAPLGFSWLSWLLLYARLQLSF